jgi:oligosaccharide translocation protein RFT1
VGGFERGRRCRERATRTMPNSASKILSSASEGATALVSASLLARFLTFASNVVVARTVGRAALGVGTLRLDEVLFLGPLLITNTGLRKVAYRGSTAADKQSLVNLCWLTVPFGLVLSAAIAFTLMQSPPEEARGAEEGARYRHGIYYTLFALVLSFLTEPMFVLSSSQMLQTLRARTETSAVFMKCFVTTVLTVVIGGWGVDAFAIGNVAYAMTMMLGYSVWFFRDQPGREGSGKEVESRVSLLPQQLPGGAKWWKPEIYSAAVIFWAQSIQKWFLENGEKVALVFLGSSQDAGEYVLVSNLGSIVARLLLQPVEEMSLAAFCKLSNLMTDDGQEGETLKKDTVAALLSTIKSLVLAMTLGGSLLASFAPAYSHLLLHLLYGPTWSDSSAPLLLALYAVYVLTMSINGVAEAFVHGVEDEAGLKRYNWWTFGFSVAFLGSVAILIRFGPAGLILANIVKMLCRCTVCLFMYIKPYFRRNGVENFQLSHIFPSKYALFSFLVSFFITQLSLRFVYHDKKMVALTLKIPERFHEIGTAVLHIFVGLFCIVLNAFVVWKCHRQDIRWSRGPASNDGKVKKS